MKHLIQRKWLLKVFFNSRKMQEKLTNSWFHKYLRRRRLYDFIYAEKITNNKLGYKCYTRVNISLWNGITLVYHQNQKNSSRLSQLETIWQLSSGTKKKKLWQAIQITGGTCCLVTFCFSMTMHGRILLRKQNSCLQN